MTATTEYRRSATVSDQSTICNPKSTISAAPPLSGWVNGYFRHYNGKKLGPYYVRRWKVGRRVFKEYIKPKDVERVKAQCLAHRERQLKKKAAGRDIVKFIANYNFIGKMLDRWDKGKVVSPIMEAYLLRIHNEGMHITGRPSLRRKVTRTIIEIGGKKYIVKTVFEFDGTTKAFMVPFFTNHFLDPFEAMLKLANDAWHAVNGPKTEHLIPNT